MSSMNITEFFESIIYPPLGVPGELNSSFISDIEDLEDISAISGIEDLQDISAMTSGNNATQLLLSNGTRTKVPKYVRRARRAPIISDSVQTISFYTCPVIVVVGLMSNILAYLVFTRTRLRKVPSVPYLAAMAVVDSGQLITEFIQYGLRLHGIHIIIWSGVCQYTTYLGYIFIFLCIWYPVALCVEKFISVYLPLRKAALCTTFRAKVVVICMMVMTGTCYYYVIYMTGPVLLGNVTTCQVWEVFRKDFSNLMMLDYVFTFVVPSIVLIVLVILICGRGCEYYRISTTADVSNRLGTTRNASILAPARVTNVIFPVIFLILALKLPMGLLRLYGVISSSHDPLIMDLQIVLLYLGRFEYAIKLYVYLIFSPSFRRRSKSFVCSVRAKIKGRCRQDSIEEDEAEGIAVAPRINLPETGERGSNQRAFLMASDV